MVGPRDYQSVPGCFWSSFDRTLSLVLAVRKGSRDADPRQFGAASSRNSDCWGGELKSEI